MPPHVLVLARSDTPECHRILIPDMWICIQVGIPLTKWFSFGRLQTKETGPPRAQVANFASAKRMMRGLRGT